MDERDGRGMQCRGHDFLIYGWVLISSIQEVDNFNQRSPVVQYLDGKAKTQLNWTYRTAVWRAVLRLHLSQAIVGQASRSAPYGQGNPTSTMLMLAVVRLRLLLGGEYSALRHRWMWYGRLEHSALACIILCAKIGLFQPDMGSSFVVGTLRKPHLATIGLCLCVAPQRWNPGYRHSQ